MTGINRMALAGAHVDGIMGGDILGRFRIVIDLKEDRMRWTRLSYNPPPPSSLMEITGASRPPSRKALDRFEAYTKFASNVFVRKPEPPPVKRGYLGIELAEVSGFVIVERVYPEGPAAVAAIQTGDRITSMAIKGETGKTVRTIAEVMKMAASRHPGDVVQLTVARGDKLLTIPVTAGEGDF